jgi:metal-dependent amidase/aminoacylase/carboxypeptidase family protein
MHQVILKKGSFAAASRGMTIELRGKTSHAGEPENGINPAMAISRIIRGLQEVNRDKAYFKDLSFTTVIHLSLGSIAFGTSAGHAEMRLTLRTFENEDMHALCQRVESLVSAIARSERLELRMSYSEIFPAIVNDPGCVSLIRESASENGLSIKRKVIPFRWSEDFGYYTTKYKGGFFGLGSGESQPALHNPDYDFPDELIGTGVSMFHSICKKILQSNK